MERTEVRLNEKEMECKDCAAKKGPPAKAPVYVSGTAASRPLLRQPRFESLLSNLGHS